MIKATQSVHGRPFTQLDDEDRTHITEVFFEELVPKLKRLQARIGMLDCSFAGEKYANWLLHFKSTGADFSIVDFEYDEDSRSLSLDL